MSLTSYQRDKLISDLKKKYDAEEGDGTLFTTTRILIENYLLFVKKALNEAETGQIENFDPGYPRYVALEYFFNFRKSLVGLEDDDNDAILKTIDIDDFRHSFVDLFFWKYPIIDNSEDLPSIIFLMLIFESKSFAEIIRESSEEVLRNVIEFLYDISIVYGVDEVNSTKEYFVESIYLFIRCAKE